MAEPLRLRGNALFAAGDHAGAAALYSEALAVPDCGCRAALLSNRAACRLALHSPSEAEADARAALEVDPSFCKAHLRLAAALSAQGKPGAAYKAASRGVEAATDEALRGQLRSACEEYKKARDSEVMRVVRETGAQALQESTHMSPLRAMCQGCGAAESPQARFKTCSRCMSVKYCSVICAAEHWHEAHQPVCDNLRRMRQRAKADGAETGTAPSLRHSTDLLKDFVLAHTDHWVACQVLAFALQHWQSPPWGGAACAVDIQIRDVARLRRGADSLVATILPLSTLLTAIRRDKSGDDMVSAMRDSTEMLKRVDVDVGFVVLVAPEHEEDEICAHPRVRYTLSQEQLRRLMLKAKQEGLISVDMSTVPFTAEIKTKRLIGDGELLE
jgi:hypothetical protein